MKRSIGLIGLIGLLSACTWTTLGLTRREYLSAVRASTRSRTVFVEGDQNLEVHATYLSDDFREAYIREYVRVYALSPEEAAAFAEGQRGQGAAADQFVFAAQTSNPKLNDFDSLSSLWRLGLQVSSDAMVRPNAVVRMPGRPDLARRFYPHVNPWMRVYVVSFPKVVRVENGERAAFRLVVSSPFGQGMMEW